MQNEAEGIKRYSAGRPLPHAIKQVSADDHKGEIHDLEEEDQGTGGGSERLDKGRKDHFLYQKGRA